MHVGHLLTRAACEFPDRPAWIDRTRVVSFAQAEERVNRLAHALLGIGAARGDRIGMLLPNCPEGLETIFAPMKSGMAVVPVNIRLHPREVGHILNDADVRAVVYGADFHPQVSSLKTELRADCAFVCVGSDGSNDLEYERFLESGLPSPPHYDSEPDDLAWLFYTSGTTGQPKGAMLTHRNLLTMAQLFLCDLNPAQPSDVLLHAAAITHGSGLSAFHHVARGAASAFPPGRSFEPTAVFEAIQRHRATTMFMAPTMIASLARHPDRHRYDLSSLHTILYGGAPMYVDQQREALDAFGPILVQLFGQGEAPMTCLTLSKDDHVAGTDPVKIGRLASAGRATTGVRIRIVDERDEDVPSGEHGEIVVRSDLVMKGYWKQPEATADTLRNGWLHTGDVGYVDANGYFFVTDRKKDLIISGGYNIYPREVEEVICMHPAVAEVAVVGVPNERWGEAVKAFVVLRAGTSATEQDLIEHCRSSLASYKKPQSVEFITALPKNAYGKILKRELRDAYWTNRSRRI